MSLFTDINNIFIKSNNINNIILNNINIIDHNNLYGINNQYIKYNTDNKLSWSDLFTNGLYIDINNKSDRKELT